MLLAARGIGGEADTRSPFLRGARWEGGIAHRSGPHEDQVSVPGVRFGRPAVGGLSTEVFWEHSEDGEDDDEVAEVYGRTARDVTWALAYDRPRRAKARQRNA